MKEIINNLFIVRLVKFLYLQFLLLDYKTCAEMPAVKHSKYLYIQNYKLRNKNGTKKRK